MHSELGQIPLFHDLPTPIFSQIEAATVLRAVKRGEVIRGQGQPVDQVFVMKSGCCRLVQHTKDGRDVTLTTFVVPGEPIGLVIALNDGVYPGTIEVVKSGELFQFPATLVRKIVEIYPQFYEKLLHEVHLRLREAHERIRELSTERVEQRIARSTMRLAQKIGTPSEDGTVHLNIQISRQDLAQMSGTTLETVSRTLKLWERDALITTGRERIGVLDLEQLASIAEG